MSEIRLVMNEEEQKKVDILKEDLKIGKDTDLVRYLITKQYEASKKKEGAES